MMKVVSQKVGGQKSRRGTRHWNPRPEVEVKLNPSTSVDATRWRQELEADAEPYVRNVLNSFYRTTTNALNASGQKADPNAFGVTLGPSTDFVEHHAVLRRSLEQHTKRIGEFADTTTDAIRDLIAVGDAAGLGITDIANSIADLVDRSRGYWAERVARTEMVGAANEASHVAAQDSGVVSSKTWLTAHDARVRDSHAEMDGEEVGLDELFSNGLNFPGDPDGEAGEVINCRCTMLMDTGGNEVDITGQDEED